MPSEQLAYILSPLSLDFYLFVWKKYHKDMEPNSKRTVRSQLYSSHPGYGILLWQPQWTKTACKRTMYTNELVYVLCT